MLAQILTVLGFTSIAVASFAASGTLAVFFPPKRLMQSYLQHFAAGVVFAAVAVEVLPDVMHRNAPVAASVGFALGVAAMLAVRRLSERIGKRQEGGGRGEWSMVLVIGIDVLIDGLLLGAAFTAGQTLGALLVLALSAEFLSLGPSTSSQLIRNGIGRRTAILMTLGVASLSWIGGLAGILVLSSASDAVMETVLAFGSAAFLYLVTEELLVEAHEAAETPFATTLFFVGFLAVLVIGMAVH
jgi:zinc transporter, ZIP family